MLGGLPGLDLRIRRVVAVPTHMLRPALVHMQRCRMQLSEIILLSLVRHVPGFRQAAYGLPHIAPHGLAS